MTTAHTPEPCSDVQLWVATVAELEDPNHAAASWAVLSPAKNVMPSAFISNAIETRSLLRARCGDTCSRTMLPSSRSNGNSLPTNTDDHASSFRCSMNPWNSIPQNPVTWSSAPLRVDSVWALILKGWIDRYLKVLPSQHSPLARLPHSSCYLSTTGTSVSSLSGRLRKPTSRPEAWGCQYRWTR